MSDERYCTDCRHCWVNSDGIQMCGRQRQEGEAGPLFCFNERANVQPTACGYRARFFEAKTP